MGIGFKHSGAGGGAGLNFRVIGGTEQPTAPRENDIWVNTDTEISTWVFSATEPGNPAPGMVWIEVGAESDVGFNALKKNGIGVYPVWVRQYMDGAFADRYAYIFRSGEWVQFSDVFKALYIIKDGAVDLEKYPYKYVQQYWDSSSSSNKTRTGGVDPNFIKFEQDYEGKPAVWTEATNGNWQRNEFSNIVVPNSASVFYFQYYRLPVYKNATIQVGSASVSVARDGAATPSLYNETVAIDVTALRGQTVTFSYTTYGQSGHQNCYVGNAWFE